MRAPASWDVALSRIAIGARPLAQGSGTRRGPPIASQCREVFRALWVYELAPFLLCSRHSRHCADTAPQDEEEASQAAEANEDVEM